jgi:hypothetical protein
MARTSNRLIVRGSRGSCRDFGEVFSSPTKHREVGHRTPRWAAVLFIVSLMRRNAIWRIFMEFLGLLLTPWGKVFPVSCSADRAGSAELQALCQKVIGSVSLRR